MRIRNAGLIDIFFEFFFSISSGDWSDYLASPGYTLLAGMLCGVVVNFLARYVYGVAVQGAGQCYKSGLNTCRQY